MKSVEKTIKILDCLSDAERSLGVTEISSLLSIPKSTVHRILTTLLNHSIVTRDSDTSKYRLGVQILKYANSFYDSFDFRQYSKNILKAVCMETHLTTFLCIWQNDNVICIDSINLTNKTNTHQLFVEVGKTMPFHCAASAKILLAFQSLNKISNIIKNNNLDGYTSKTITDSGKLIKHLELIRTQGYAICDEELEEGIRAISVPVKDLNGQAIASITITGLISRVPTKKYQIK
ncbi:MAG: IclR family transcriptional regulator [Atribacterota bacterium]|nr:IclR family transcriptional regulator [Atribacterota bacterium]